MDNFESITHIQNTVYVLLWIMIGSNLVNIYFLVNQIINLRADFFKRMWSYVDALIILTNLTIIVNSLLTKTISIQNQRIIESILMIFLQFKMLYYLALVGEIAPLIDMIF